MGSVCDMMNVLSSACITLLAGNCSSVMVNVQVALMALMLFFKMLYAQFDLCFRFTLWWLPCFAR